MIYGHLYEELQAIASVELADALASWPDWTEAVAAQLARYLREELGQHGMLTVEQGREAGHAMGEIRREARAVIARIEGRCRGLDHETTNVEAAAAFERHRNA